MKQIVIMIAIGAALGVFQSAYSADAARGMDEAKEHGCLACHDVDKKKVGPAYKDVSAKYKGKTADEVMAGKNPKPVHKSVLQKTTDSSLKEIVGWILSL